MKKSLFTSAIILSAGALITRVIGAVYKIPLTHILGPVGIGMYQMVFPIFALLIVVSTSGMPLAISSLIAKQSTNYSAKKKIIKTCFLNILIFSIVVSLLLSIFSWYIAKLQGNTDLYISYIAIAPAVVLVGILSVFRGYFQGEEIYSPTALSQIIEQLIKVAFGLSFSVMLAPYGMKYQVFGAILAVSFSELFAVIIIWFQYKKYNKPYKNSLIASDSYNKEIIKTIVPIVLSAVIFPLASVIDSFVVVNILKTNFTTDIATAMYGIETGVVSALLNLPTVISFSLATVILPSLSVESDEVKRQEKISKILSVNLAVILPCVLGFMFFANPIIKILYGQSIVSAGFDGTALAISILTISAIGILYFSFLQIFSSVLQAIGKAKIAVINLIIAVALKFGVEIVILFNPNLNIYGLVIGNLLCYLTAFVINYLFVRKYIRTNIKEFSAIFASSIVAILVIGLGYMIFNNNIGFIVIVLLSIVLYFYLIKSQTNLFDELSFKKNYKK